MKHFLFTLLFLLTTHIIFAQEAVQYLGLATVSCPNEWTKYREFYYEITIPVNRDFASCVKPDFGSIDDVFGPMESFSHSINFVDGHMLETDMMTYRWKLMVHKNEGEYIIPSFTVLNDSTAKYFLVPETTIVIKDDIPIADDCFIQWKLDGEPDYSKGEIIPCHLELYTGPHLSKICNYQIDCPDDVYLTDVSPEEEIKERTVVYNHKLYNCYTLKKYYYVPLSTGSFKLPDVSVELKMSKPQSAFSSIIDYFFNMDYYELLSTSDVYLNVNSNYSFVPDTLLCENKGIAVCVDVSSSMKIEDVGQSRLACASKLISCLQLNARFGHLSQYMSFSKFMEHDWCRDMSHFIDTLQKPCTDGTAVYDALVYPITSLSGCKDVIIITDGADNASHISAGTARDILKDYNVRPHVIYLNSLRDSVMAFCVNAFNEEVESMVPNDKLEDAKLDELKRSLQTLGGDLYVVRNENEINKVVRQLLKNATGYEKMNKGITASYNFKNNFVLRKLKEDFYSNILLRSFIGGDTGLDNGE